ncbi:MAG: class I SAM-dependent methyltransferase [Acidimicrobiales bacterium]
MTAEPDPIFADPRLAAIYDPLDPDRSDLDAYAAIAAELGARTVLDLGCGTGTFACRLAARGLDVVAVDPAEASLAVARAKPDADRVRWVRGDATTLPADIDAAVDLVTMTANVAQVFLTDDDWAATLAGVRAALRPGGHLVFEVRDPAREAWRAWTREASLARVDVPGVGVVEHWVEVTQREGPLVSFRWTYRFERAGEVATSDSTLRFRDRREIEASLAAAGLDVREVRDAADRPGLELVFLVGRP